MPVPVFFPTRKYACVASRLIGPVLIGPEGPRPNKWDVLPHASCPLYAKPRQCTCMQRTRLSARSRNPRSTRVAVGATQTVVSSASMTRTGTGALDVPLTRAVTSGASHQRRLPETLEQSARLHALAIVLKAQGERKALGTSRHARPSMPTGSRTAQFARAPAPHEEGAASTSPPRGVSPASSMGPLRGGFRQLDGTTSG